MPRLAGLLCKQAAISNAFYVGGARIWVIAALLPVPVERHHGGCRSRSEALPGGISEGHTAVTPPMVFLLQIFSQEYINLLLSMYFFVLGILALSHTIR